MTDIARLTVALYANSAQFVAELQRSQKKAQTWSSQVSGAFKTSATASAAAATASVAALTAVYAQQSQLIDQTTTMSDALGMTTESFTQLRYAANLTGASEAFDSAMESMVVKLGEAVNGGGEAVEALDMLGLSAVNLGKLTPDQQLYTLADAINQVDNASQKAFLVDSIFGGTEFVNMMNQGSQGLKAMAEEANVLGITLTRVDAAKIEMANDAMYRTQVIMSGWQQQISVELAPLVASLADEMTRAAKSAGGMGVVVTESLESIINAVGFVGDVWRGWDLIINSSVVAVQGYKLVVTSYFQAIIDGAVKVGEHVVKGMVWPMQDALDSLAPYSDKAAELAKSLDNITSFNPPKLLNVPDAQLDFSQSLWELRDLASKPLPSVALDSWYQGARDRIQKTAELYANTFNNTGTNNNIVTLPVKPISNDGQQGEDPAVTAFKQANDTIQLEWQRRVAMQTAGDQAVALQEQFAYDDKLTRLSAHYLKANDAAINNQALQTELETEYLAARQVLWQEHNANIEQQNLGFWERYGESLQQNMMSMDELTSETLNNFANNMGSAFESMIFDSQSIGDAFSNLAEGMARSVVSALGQMAGQWLAYQAVQLLVGKTTATAAASGMAINAQVASMMAGLNAFASTAAIPLVGPAMAPAAMTAALAVTTPIATTIGVLAGGAAGMAHNGISSIPSEGTWLLDKGERVYTNDSAQKLDHMYQLVNQQANNRQEITPNWSVIVYDAPAGTRTEVDEKEKVVRIMLEDANKNGDYYNYISSKLGVNAGGYK